MRVQAPPGISALVAGLAVADVDPTIAFCNGAKVERARIAADMRRRAEECRDAVSRLRAAPPTVNEESDFQAVPTQYRSICAASAQRMIDHQTREYVSVFLTRASVFDDYAEDLERVPS